MFDKVAQAYHLSTPQLPSEFVRLVRETFDLQASDRVLDLGCGSGLLTFHLADTSSSVQGLDASLELLSLAKEADTANRIEWIRTNVEDFEFLPDRYKLVIAFESFHLFPQKTQLIRQITHSLRTGGFFSVGWCDYHWEHILRDTIIQTFSEHGITWGEWGYQSIPQLQTIASSIKGLGIFETKSISVDQFSFVEDIARYLVSIDKSSGLSTLERSEFQQELTSRFRTLVGADPICGASAYSISYAHRCDADTC